MSTFAIKRGDTSPGIEYQIGAYSEGGNILAGASARFIMARGSTVKVDASATVTDEGGILRYAGQAGDTDTAGVYNAEFEVTYSDGSIESFPNDGWITVTVGDDLG